MTIDEFVVELKAVSKPGMWRLVGSFILSQDLMMCPICFLAMAKGVNPHLHTTEHRLVIEGLGLSSADAARIVFAADSGYMGAIRYSLLEACYLEIK